MAFPLSPVRQAGPFVIVSGQVGRDEDGTFPSSAAEQTRVVIASITRHLASHGLTLADVVKTTVFLTSMDDVTAVNEVYRTAFPEPFPARSMVGASALPVPEGVVEIEAWALQPSWNGTQSS